MYEKGSSVRVTVDIGEAGINELEFVGKVVIDGSDFMAIQFDTIIIPKTEIKGAEPLPEGQDLEQVLGTERKADDVDRPKPPRVEGVRFLPMEPERKKQAPPKRQGQPPRPRKKK